MTEPIPQLQIEPIAQEAARLLARKMIIAVAIIFAIGIAVVTAGAVAITENFSTTGRIQQTRLESCLDQNARHTNTINTLDGEFQALVLKAPQKHRAALRASLDASKSFTISLINQLAPYVSDCAAHIGSAP